MREIIVPILVPIPDPEMVLDENFSFKDFMDKLLGDKKNIKSFEEIIKISNEFHMSNDEDIELTESEKVLSDYYARMYKIVDQYRYDLLSEKVVDDIYSPKAREVAKQYFDELKKVQDDNEKVKEASTEDDYMKLIEKIQEGQADRISKFENGEIGVLDLYRCDLIHVSLEKKIRNIVVLLLTDSNYIGKKKEKEKMFETMTLGELAKKYKEAQVIREIQKAKAEIDAKEAKEAEDKQIAELVDNIRNRKQ